MTVRVQVQGFKELDKALQELPKAFARKAMIRAQKRSWQPVVDEAQRLAPRGLNPKKRGSKKQRQRGAGPQLGAGADSIKARSAKSSAVASSADARRSIGGDSFAATVVGPDIAHFYMRFPEYGTSRQRKQPFLRPAFAAHVEQVITNMATESGKSIEETIAHLLKKAQRGTLSARERKAFTS